MDRRPGTGFTLIELMVVLSIMSVLAGLSIAGFAAWKRRAMHDSCLAEVSLRLREARNFAIASAVRSVVAVDPARGSIQAWSFEPARRVSFEEGESGYSTRGEVPLVPGKLGQAADLAKGEVVMADLADLIGREGLALRVSVLLVGRPAAEGEPLTLFRGGSAFSCAVTPGLGLACQVGAWRGQTRGWVIVPGRWQELALTANAVSGELELAVDGIAATMGGGAAEKGSGRPAPPPGVIVTAIPPGRELVPAGITFGPCPCLVDEITVLAAIAGREYGVPGEFAIVGAPQRIQFGPSGGLDRRFHDEPCQILIAPSFALEELASPGRTVVAGVPDIPIPPELLSRVHVELAGRVWAEKGSSSGSTLAAAPPPPLPARKGAP